MSANMRGLGRGLDALFQNNDPVVAVRNDDAAPRPDSQKIGVDAIVPNPQQPRRQFSEQQLDELASSIRSQGVLQPILVRSSSESSGMYEIIAGERRWRAAKLAGLDAVPVIIRDLSDQEVLVVALMENLQREDLNPMEEALGLQQLRDEFGLSQEDMAHRLGKSRPAIANTLRLLALPEAARTDLAEGKITPGHARALLVVTDEEAQELFRQHLVASNCTVREAERIASVWKDTGSLPEDLSNPATSVSVTKPQAKPLLESLAVLQDRFCEALSMPVVIKGGEAKGKVSIAYSSKEELNALRELLGVSEESV